MYLVSQTRLCLGENALKTYRKLLTIRHTKVLETKGLLRHNDILTIFFGLKEYKPLLVGVNC